MRILTNLAIRRTSPGENRPVSKTIWIRIVITDEPKTARFANFKAMKHMIIDRRTSIT
jgi:hypothetical protein